MLINARSISISAAVIFFFIIAIVGWFNSFTPFTCTKRALAGAVIVYIISTIVVKVINNIIIDAIANKQIDKQGGKSNAV
jgi:hypothetical protein